MELQLLLPSLLCICHAVAAGCSARGGDGTDALAMQLVEERLLHHAIRLVPKYLQP
jgi:hypothetical protein